MNVVDLKINISTHHKKAKIIITDESGEKIRFKYDIRQNSIETQEAQQAMSIFEILRKC